MRDKRNEEFRELLEALSKSYRVELTLHAAFPTTQRLRGFTPNIRILSTKEILASC